MGHGKLQCDVVLTTYELVVAELDHKRLGAVAFMYVIVDEAHRLKNAKSKLRGQLLQLQYGHLLLLTGALTILEPEQRAADPC